MYHNQTNYEHIKTSLHVMILQYYSTSTFLLPINQFEIGLSVLMIVGIRQSIMTVFDKCHVMLKNFMLPMRCMTKIDGAERESWHLMQL